MITIHGKVYEELIPNLNPKNVLYLTLLVICKFSAV